MTTKPLKRNLFWMFFSFYGRISRREYWWAQLSLLAAFVAAVIILERSGGLDGPEVSAAAVLSIVVLLQIIWFFGICVAVKRVHDIGWPGGLAVLLFVPVLGFLFWLKIGFSRGQITENRYGPPGG